MAIRFVVLMLVCLAISLYRAMIPMERPEPVSPLEVARLLREGDAESLLALGRPIPLSQANIFDLELISGVSDTMASRIIEKKGEILTQASILPPDRKWLALTLVHGIGAKNGRKLARSIALE